MVLKKLPNLSLSVAYSSLPCRYSIRVPNPHVGIPAQQNLTNSLSAREVVQCSGVAPAAPVSFTSRNMRGGQYFPH